MRASDENPTVRAILVAYLKAEADLKAQAAAKRPKPEEVAGVDEQSARERWERILGWVTEHQFVA